MMGWYISIQYGSKGREGMTGFLDWKYISEEQLQDLERVFDEPTITQKLGDIFEVDQYDEGRQSIKRKMLLYHYAFCRKNALNHRKTAAFLSIMEDVFRRDMELLSCEKTHQTSFNYFEQMVLKHSVERPPKSIKIFEKSDVQPIVDYAMNSYYRNFKLYSYIFGVQARVFITQRVRGMVDVPAPVLPLSLGSAISLQIASPTPPVASARAEENL